MSVKRQSAKQTINDKSNQIKRGFSGAHKQAGLNKN